MATFYEVYKRTVDGAMRHIREHPEWGQTHATAKYVCFCNGHKWRIPRGWPLSTESCFCERCGKRREGIHE